MHNDYGIWLNDFVKFMMFHTLRKWCIHVIFILGQLDRFVSLFIPNKCTVSVKQLNL